MHESFKASFAAQLDAAPKSFWTRLFKLQNILQANKTDLMAAFPTENELVTWALSLYDQFITPIDIPVIPEVVEATLDKVFKGLIEQTIRQWYPG